MKLPKDFAEELRLSLVDAGVNPYGALMVAGFVTQCYDLLLSSHQALVQPARWAQFCSTRGATTKRINATKKPANISETAITAELSREAQRLLQKRAGIAPSVAGVSIACVIADHTAPSDIATGSSSKRPDLVFFPADPALKLQFAMEAKVIRLASGIAKDLLGEAGLGCFVRAIDPYETNGVVGLMGYVEPLQTQAMMREIERCMLADMRFTKVEAQDLVVSAKTPIQQLRVAVGSIANSGPKVCIANMLALELTTSYPPQLLR